MPVRWATRCWIVNLICSKSGRTIKCAASRRGSLVGGPFATKPQLARQPLACAFAVGVPAKWVTGDSVYGDDRRLRLWLEAQPYADVLAVSVRNMSGCMGNNGRSNVSWRPCRRTAGPASVPAMGRKGPAGQPPATAVPDPTVGALLVPLVAGPAASVKAIHGLDRQRGLCPAGHDLARGGGNCR